MKISERAIDQPLVMMLLSGALFILSIAAYFMLPLEAVPEVEIPFALIYVDYPGAAPNEIESQVIKPVEEQLSQLRRVDNINATAMAGRAAIFVKFLSGTDMEESIRDLKEKVSNAEKDLPDEAEDPRVIEINFEDFPMMILNLYGDFHPNRLKDIGEDLKTKLLTIPGVSGVDIFGGLDREISISFDPALLALNNISLTQAAAMIKAQNIDNPGGWVDIGQSTILVRTLGKYSLVDDIEETIVGYGESGGVIRLKDVAEVRDTFKEPDTYSRFNGKNSLTLSISKQPGYNLIDVSDEIKRKIKDISAGFPAGLKYEFTSDQSVDIRRQINQLSTNALYGIIMVILILFLVMGFRNSLIVSFAIPFSIFMAFGFLFLFGYRLTGISLFALVMVIGIVVDGAIIMSESTYRHLEEGYNRAESAKMGVGEVGTAIVSAALTTMAAFAPIIFMSGVMGQFLSLIPKTVIFALIGTVIVDHIIVPVLCSRFMKVSKRASRFSGDWFGLRFYRKILAWSLRNRLKIIVVTNLALFMGIVVVLISSFSPLKLVKVQIFPKIPKPRFVINFKNPPGSTIEYTDRVGKEIERIVSETPEVDRYVTTVGQTGIHNVRISQGGAFGSEVGQITVDLVNASHRRRDVGEIIASLRKRLKRFPGTEINFDIIREGPPIITQVIIDVKGKDIEKLSFVADKIAQFLKMMSGVEEVQTAIGIKRPEFKVKVNHNRAALYGLTSRDISTAVAAAVHGFMATKYLDGDEEVEVWMRLKEADGKKLIDLSVIRIPTSRGDLIPLTNVADISYSVGPAFISRKNFERTVSVFAELEKGYEPGDIKRKLNPFLKGLNIPSGVSIEYGGIEDETVESFRSLGRAMIIAIFIIFIILAAQFKSIKQPMLILVTVPLSFIGVIFGLLITRVPFGLMAFFGIVALAGVVVNDAIVLVSYVNSLREKGMDLVEALKLGGKNRLRPILMTTVTTIAGIFPLTLNLGGGAEYWRPLAVSIIFGLLMATMLTLIVVPVWYSIFEEGFLKLSRSYIRKSFKRFSDRG